MERIYIIVRNDLSPGLQLPQACHALREFGADYPELDRIWYSKHRNIVVLQVSGLPQLVALANEAAKREIPCSRFLEPDLNDEMTAIALAPEAACLVSSLPLALRVRKTKVEQSLVL